MLALHENIVPAEYRVQMEQQQRHHYSVETDYHLDTGIVLTPVLLEYLTENDQVGGYGQAHVYMPDMDDWGKQDNNHWSFAYLDKDDGLFRRHSGAQGKEE